LICEFIAEHRARFGVAPICRVLSEHGCKIAPRTFYAWQARPPSKRALWDMTVTEILAGYYTLDADGRRKPESLYGAAKMWAHLQRQGIAVAKCTVERLMRANGWQGVRRVKKVRTTVADPAAQRAPDLVDRKFAVDAPNRLLVADFTYVQLVTGVFVYTAFVVDAYAGRSWAGRAQRPSTRGSSNRRSVRPQRCGPVKPTPWRGRRFTTPMPGRNTRRCTAVRRSCSPA
jgi:putative transposase